MRESVELFVRDAVQWLRLGIETIGALIVATGVAVACVQLARALAARRRSAGAVGPPTFTPIRLVLARYLALALEFQLGADILSTAVAPTWTQIGQLGAIAIIRTALNFFLAREMRDEQRTTAAEAGTTARAAAQSERGG